MFNITELAPGECRGPLTDDLPHYFCGEPTAEAESYCPECKARFHIGSRGKNVRSLEAMIYAFDRSVSRKADLVRVLRASKAEKTEGGVQKRMGAEEYALRECERTGV